MRTMLSREPQRTWVTYAFLIGILVVAKLVFLLVPVSFPSRSQTEAFSWPMIAAISVLGAVGVLLGPFAGIADSWATAVTMRQRVWLPIADGVVYGLITVARDLRNPEDVHLAFPLSIPFYAFGAVFLEILLRVFGLTVLTALLWRLIFRGRRYALAFWTANIATSLYEPLPFMSSQLTHAARIAIPGIIVDWAFQPLFLANLLTGWIFRRSGIVAPVILRYAFYLVWHVGYGGLIRPTIAVDRSFAY